MIEIDLNHAWYEFVMWVYFTAPRRISAWWHRRIILVHYRGGAGYSPGKWLKIGEVYPFGEAYWGVGQKPILRGPLVWLWILDKLMWWAGVYVIE